MDDDWCSPNYKFKQWKAFSNTCTIEDLRNVIKLEKCSDLPREELRELKSRENLDITLGYYLDDWSVRKFIMCHCIDRFFSAQDDDWSTPKDMFQYENYNHCFVLCRVPDPYRLVIPEFEILSGEGYLEKHPDDVEINENTRYRIKI